MPRTKLVTSNLTILIATGQIERFDITQKILRRPSKGRHKVLIPVERRHATIPCAGAKKSIAGTNPMTRALQAMRQAKSRDGKFTDPADPGLEALQRTLAKPEGLHLFIEEPELHLEPARQRAMARVLAQAIHYGVKVFMTTQSDWIMKELNLAIMAGEMLTAKKTELTRNKKLLRKHGYREDQRIQWKQVKAYELRGKELKPCKIDEFGIDAPTLDGLIDVINDASNAFCDRIERED